MTISHDITPDKFKQLMNVVGTGKLPPRLIVDSDGSVHKTNVFQFALEKISGWVGLKDMCNNKLIGLSIINYLDYAVSNPEEFGYDEELIQKIEILKNLATQLLKTKKQPTTEEGAVQDPTKNIEALANKISNLLKNPINKEKSDELHKDVQDFNNNFLIQKGMTKYAGDLPQVVIKSIIKSSSTYQKVMKPLPPITGAYEKTEKAKQTVKAKGEAVRKTEQPQPQEVAAPPEPSSLIKKSIVPLAQQPKIEEEAKEPEVGKEEEAEEKGAGGELGGEPGEQREEEKLPLATAGMTETQTAEIKKEEPAPILMPIPEAAEIPEPKPQEVAASAETPTHVEEKIIPLSQQPQKVVEEPKEQKVAEEEGEDKGTKGELGGETGQQREEEKQIPGVSPTETPITEVQEVETEKTPEVEQPVQKTAGWMGTMTKVGLLVGAGTLATIGTYLLFPRIFSIDPNITNKLNDSGIPVEPKKVTDINISETDTGSIQATPGIYTWPTFVGGEKSLMLPPMEQTGQVVDAKMIASWPANLQIPPTPLPGMRFSPPGGFAPMIKPSKMQAVFETAAEIPPEMVPDLSNTKLFEDNVTNITQPETASTPSVEEETIDTETTQPTPPAGPEEAAEAAPEEISETAQPAAVAAELTPPPQPEVSSYLSTIGTVIVVAAGAIVIAGTTIYNWTKKSVPQSTGAPVSAAAPKPTPVATPAYVVPAQKQQVPVVPQQPVETASHVGGTASKSQQTAPSAPTGGPSFVATGVSPGPQKTTLEEVIEDFPLKGTMSARVKLTDDWDQNLSIIPSKKDTNVQMMENDTFKTIKRAPNESKIRFLENDFPVKLSAEVFQDVEKRKKTGPNSYLPGEKRNVSLETIEFVLPASFLFTLAEGGVQLMHGQEQITFNAEDLKLIIQTLRETEANLYKGKNLKKPSESSDSTTPHTTTKMDVKQLDKNGGVVQAITVTRPASQPSVTEGAEKKEAVLDGDKKTVEEILNKVDFDPTKLQAIQSLVTKELYKRNRVEIVKFITAYVKGMENLINSFSNISTTENAWRALQEGLNKNNNKLYSEDIETLFSLQDYKGDTALHNPLIFSHFLPLLRKLSIEQLAHVLSIRNSVEEFAKKNPRNIPPNLTNESCLSILSPEHIKSFLGDPEINKKLWDGCISSPSLFKTWGNSTYFCPSPEDVTSRKNWNMPRIKATEFAPPPEPGQVTESDLNHILYFITNDVLPNVETLPKAVLTKEGIEFRCPGTLPSYERKKIISDIKKQTTNFSPIEDDTARDTGLTYWGTVKIPYASVGAFLKTTKAPKWHCGVIQKELDKLRQETTTTTTTTATTTTATTTTTTSAAPALKTLQPAKTVEEVKKMIWDMARPKEIVDACAALSKKDFVDVLCHTIPNRVHIGIHTTGSIVRGRLLTDKDATVWKSVGLFEEMRKRDLDKEDIFAILRPFASLYPNDTPIHHKKLFLELIPFLAKLDVSQFAELAAYKGNEKDAITPLSSMEMKKILFHPEARPLVEKLYTSYDTQEGDVRKYVDTQPDGKTYFLPNPKNPLEKYLLPPRVRHSKSIKDFENLRFDDIKRALGDPKDGLIYDPDCIAEINKRKFSQVEQLLEIKDNKIDKNTLLHLHINRDSIVLVQKMAEPIFDKKLTIGERQFALKMLLSVLSQKNGEGLTPFEKAVRVPHAPFKEICVIVTKLINEEHPQLKLTEEQINGVIDHADLKQLFRAMYSVKEDIADRPKTLPVVLQATLPDHVQPAYFYNDVEDFKDVLPYLKRFGIVVLAELLGDGPHAPLKNPDILVAATDPIMNATHYDDYPGTLKAKSQYVTHDESGNLCFYPYTVKDKREIYILKKALAKAAAPASTPASSAAISSSVQQPAIAASASTSAPATAAPATTASAPKKDLNYYVSSPIPAEEVAEVKKKLIALDANQLKEQLGIHTHQENNELLKHALIIDVLSNQKFKSVVGDILQYCRVGKEHNYILHLHLNQEAYALLNYVSSRDTLTKILKQANRPEGKWNDGKTPLQLLADNKVKLNMSDAWLGRLTIGDLSSKYSPIFTPELLNKLLPEKVDKNVLQFLIKLPENTLTDFLSTDGNPYISNKENFTEIVGIFNKYQHEDNPLFKDFNSLNKIFSSNPPPLDQPEILKLAMPVLMKFAERIDRPKEIALDADLKNFSYMPKEGVKYTLPNTAMTPDPNRTIKPSNYLAYYRVPISSENGPVLYGEVNPEKQANPEECQKNLDEFYKRNFPYLLPGSHAPLILADHPEQRLQKGEVLIPIKVEDLPKASSPDSKQLLQSVLLLPYSWVYGLKKGDVLKLQFGLNPIELTIDDTKFDSKITIDAHELHHRPKVHLSSKEAVNLKQYPNNKEIMQTRATVNEIKTLLKKPEGKQVRLINNNAILAAEEDPIWKEVDLIKNPAVEVELLAISQTSFKQANYEVKKLGIELKAGFSINRYKFGENPDNLHLKIADEKLIILIKKNDKEITAKDPAKYLMAIVPLKEKNLSTEHFLGNRISCVEGYINGFNFVLKDTAPTPIAAAPAASFAASSASLSTPQKPAALGASTSSTAAPAVSAASTATPPSATAAAKGTVLEELMKYVSTPIVSDEEKNKVKGKIDELKGAELNTLLNSQSAGVNELLRNPWFVDVLEDLTFRKIKALKIQDGEKNNILHLHSTNKDVYSKAYSLFNTHFASTDIFEVLNQVNSKGKRPFEILADSGHKLDLSAGQWLARLEPDQIKTLFTADLLNKVLPDVVDDNLVKFLRKVPQPLLTDFLSLPNHRYTTNADNFKKIIPLLLPQARSGSSANLSFDQINTIFAATPSPLSNPEIFKAAFDLLSLHALPIDRPSAYFELVPDLTSFTYKPREGLTFSIPNSQMIKNPNFEIEPKKGEAYYQYPSWGGVRRPPMVYGKSLDQREQERLTKFYNKEIDYLLPGSSYPLELAGHPERKLEEGELLIPIETNNTGINMEHIYVPYSWVCDLKNGDTLKLKLGLTPLELKITSITGKPSFASEVATQERTIYRDSKPSVSINDETVKLQKYPPFSEVLKKRKVIHEMKSLLQNPEGKRISLDSGKNAVPSDVEDPIWTSFASAKESEVKILDVFVNYLRMPDQVVADSPHDASPGFTLSKGDDVANLNEVHMKVVDEKLMILVEKKEVVEREKAKVLEKKYLITSIDLKDYGLEKEHFLTNRISCEINEKSITPQFVFILKTKAHTPLAADKSSTAAATASVAARSDAAASSIAAPASPQSTVAAPGATAPAASTEAKNTKLLEVVSMVTDAMKRAITKESAKEITEACKGLSNQDFVKILCTPFIHNEIKTSTIGNVWADAKKQPSESKTSFTPVVEFNQPLVFIPGMEDLFTQARDRNLTEEEIVKILSSKTTESQAFGNGTPLLCIKEKFLQALPLLNKLSMGNLYNLLSSDVKEKAPLAQLPLLKILFHPKARDLVNKLYAEVETNKDFFTKDQQGNLFFKGYLLPMDTRLRPISLDNLNFTVFSKKLKEPGMMTEYGTNFISEIKKRLEENNIPTLSFAWLFTSIKDDKNNTLLHHQINDRCYELLELFKTKAISLTANEIATRLAAMLSVRNKPGLTPLECAARMPYAPYVKIGELIDYIVTNLEDKSKLEQQLKMICNPGDLKNLMRAYKSIVGSSAKRVQLPFNLLAIVEEMPENIQPAFFRNVDDYKAILPELKKIRDAGTIGELLAGGPNAPFDDPEIFKLSIPFLRDLKEVRYEPQEQKSGKPANDEYYRVDNNGDLYFVPQPTTDRTTTKYPLGKASTTTTTTTTTRTTTTTTAAITSGAAAAPVAGAQSRQAIGASGTDVAQESEALKNLTKYVSEKIPKEEEDRVKQELLKLDYKEFGVLLRKKNNGTNELMSNPLIITVIDEREKKQSIFDELKGLLKIVDENQNTLLHLQPTPAAFGLLEGIYPHVDLFNILKQENSDKKKPLDLFAENKEKLNLASLTGRTFGFGWLDEGYAKVLFTADLLHKLLPAKINDRVIAFLERIPQPIIGKLLSIPKNRYVSNFENFKKIHNHILIKPDKFNFEQLNEIFAIDPSPLSDEDILDVATSLLMQFARRGYPQRRKEFTLSEDLKSFTYKPKEGLTFEMTNLDMKGPTKPEMKGKVFFRSEHVGSQLGAFIFGQSADEKHIHSLNEHYYGKIGYLLPGSSKPLFLTDNPKERVKEGEPLVPISVDDQTRIVGFGFGVLFLPESWISEKRVNHDLRLTYGTQPMILTISTPEGVPTFMSFEKDVKKAADECYRNRIVYTKEGAIQLKKYQRPITLVSGRPDMKGPTQPTQQAIGTSDTDAVQESEVLKKLTKYVSEKIPEEKKDKVKQELLNLDYKEFDMLLMKKNNGINELMNNPLIITVIVKRQEKMSFEQELISLLQIADKNQNTLLHLHPIPEAFGLLDRINDPVDLFNILKHENSDMKKPLDLFTENQEKLNLSNLPGRTFNFYWLKAGYEIDLFTADLLSKLLPKKVFEREIDLLKKMPPMIIDELLSIPNNPYLNDFENYRRLRDKVLNEQQKTKFDSAHNDVFTHRGLEDKKIFIGGALLAGSIVDSLKEIVNKPEASTIRFIGKNGLESTDLEDPIWKELDSVKETQVKRLETEHAQKRVKNVGGGYLLVDQPGFKFQIKELADVSDLHLKVTNEEVIMVIEHKDTQPKSYSIAIRKLIDDKITKDDFLQGRIGIEEVENIANQKYCNFIIKRSPTAPVTGSIFFDAAATNKAVIYGESKENRCNISLQDEYSKQFPYLLLDSQKQLVLVSNPENKIKLGETCIRLEIRGDAGGQVPKEFEDCIYIPYKWLHNLKDGAVLEVKYGEQILRLNCASFNGKDFAPKVIEAARDLYRADVQKRAFGVDIKQCESEPDVLTGIDIRTAVLNEAKELLQKDGKNLSLDSDGNVNVSAEDPVWKELSGKQQSDIKVLVSSKSSRSDSDMSIPFNEADRKNLHMKVVGDKLLVLIKRGEETHLNCIDLDNYKLYSNLLIGNCIRCQTTPSEQALHFGLKPGVERKRDASASGKPPENKPPLISGQPSDALYKPKEKDDKNQQT